MIKTLFKNMNKDLRQGIFFGINSGILATVGLIVGVAQTTTNPLYIVVSVLSLAISDGIGESYGIFLSKKAENTENKGYGPIYSLISLLLAKIFTVLLFLIPLLFNWDIKYYKNLIWPIFLSLIMLTIIDYNLAKLRDEKLHKFVVPHYILLALVVFSTKIIGMLLNKIN